MITTINLTSGSVAYINEAVTLERRTDRRPPRNFRDVTLPRLCVNCSLLLTDGEITYCTRPDGPVFETGLYEEWQMVCDNWVKL